jgi:hypothetical protein
MGGIEVSIFKRGTNEPEKHDDLEGEIREFVRRDVAIAEPRRQSQTDGELVASNVGSLLHHVSLNSVQEIDRLIAELETLKDRLRHAADHVHRRIVDYASLSQATVESTRVIAESLTHWKKRPDAPITAE